MATVTDIKDIKYDLVKGIFEIDDMDIIRKIKIMLSEFGKESLTEQR